MVNIGDKMVVTKKVASFLDEGDIIKIVEISNNGVISFAFGNGFVHKGVMSANECEEHFKKIEEKKKAPTITQEHIDNIMNHSSFDIKKVFDKCTIIACKLPNGFVIVESSACVSPENYSEKIGIDICMKKIKDKVWELEGYRLQEELYREKMNEESSHCCCDDCDECFYDEDEEDECDDCDNNCDYCDDYGCLFNSNMFLG